MDGENGSGQVQRELSDSEIPSVGQRVLKKNFRSDEALIKLSEIFNHSNTAITRKYLGIRAEEIKDIYLNL